MRAIDCKIGLLVWFQYGRGPALLCRVALVGTANATVKVVSATDAQVLASGYGVGDLIHAAHAALSPAN